MSASPHVIAVDIKNFEQEVLHGSSRLPVVVDFWAPWCEPCKVLGPMLEKLAVEYAGAFLLAKINVDENPELAQAFRVESVPMVMLVTEGRPVDAFAGALPEAELRAFLQKHVGAAGAPAGPLGAVEELEAAGDFAAALQLLEPWLAANPDDHEARVALARVLLAEGRLEEAREVFDALPEEARDSEGAKAVAARLELMAGAGDVEALRAELEAEPKNIAKRIELGQALVASGQTEEGLEELLGAAIRDLHFDDGAPRKALLEVFQALGASDSLTLEFQQRLSVLLCS